MLEENNIFEGEGTDQVFNVLKNEVSPLCAEAKVFIQKLWEETCGYLDSDLVNQLRSQFHQRFWEMYLVAALLESGKELEKGRSKRPDICIKSTDFSKTWIEAVTVSSGTTKDAVPELQPKDVRSVPDTQIKLRLLSAFHEKFKKFSNYKEKQIVNDNEPYIIAINDAQISSARPDDDDIPRIVSSLLPFGDPVITIDRHTLEVIDSRYSYQGGVAKVLGELISTASFSNPEYSGVSAVIYSCVDVLNFPEKLCCGLLLFHNPLARNPLPLGFLKHGSEYWVEEEQLKNKNWNFSECQVESANNPNAPDR